MVMAGGLRLPVSKREQNRKDFPRTYHLENLMSCLSFVQGSCMEGCQ